MTPATTTAAALALAAVAGLALWRRAELQGEAQQGAGWLSLANAWEEARRPLTAAPAPDLAARNVAACLQMIRMAEGTADADGYRRIFGGALFSGWADHPRRAVQFTDLQGRRLWTSAAGAYQFMAVSPLPSGKHTKVNTWDRIKAKISLPDFSPASQDRAAVALIDEAGALLDVQAGRLDAALPRLGRVWASIPGGGYAQPTKAAPLLVAAYRAAGGTLA